MWAVVEPDGKTMGRQIVACSALLVPVSLLPAVLGVSGSVYLLSAAVMGVLLFYLGVQTARQKSRSQTRRLLLASVLYLPLLFVLMALDK